MAQEKDRKTLNVPPLRFPGFTDEWIQTSVGDICTVVGGGTPDTTNNELWNGNIQWFTPSEIGKQKYVTNSIRQISKKGLDSSSAKLLPKSSILLSSRATIGECSINTIECTTNQGFQSLIPKPDTFTEFLYYLIQTKRKDLLRNSCGSTFQEISANEVRKIKVHIPSITEQKKIAVLLAYIDERIATQNKIID
ncbi:MAG: restriction endonuclease subunit S, partial [Paramuribaculum sp.]|nr:restriction endonuclease subunit S [Paramuribaculum sp.]